MWFRAGFIGLCMSGPRGIGLFVGCMTDLFVEESRDGNGKCNCETWHELWGVFTLAGGASPAPTTAKENADPSP
jgi:hypothetical protein